MTPSLGTFQAVAGMMLNSETPVLGLLCFQLFGRGDFHSSTSQRWEADIHWPLGQAVPGGAAGGGGDGQVEGAFVDGGAFLTSHC